MKKDLHQPLHDLVAPPRYDIATLAELCVVAVIAFVAGVLAMDIATAREIERWRERGGDLALAGYILVCELPLTGDCPAHLIAPSEVRP